MSGVQLPPVVPEVGFEPTTHALTFNQASLYHVSYSGMLPVFPGCPRESPAPLLKAVPCHVQALLHGRFLQSHDCGVRQMDALLAPQSPGAGIPSGRGPVFPGCLHSFAVFGVTLNGLAHVFPWCRRPESNRPTHVSLPGLTSME